MTKEIKKNPLPKKGGANKEVPKDHPNEIRGENGQVGQVHGFTGQSADEFISKFNAKVERNQQRE